MRTSSPLRYPGGKSSLFELTSTIMRTNGLERGHYAEPFAGGCGLALSLLYAGLVAEIHINDLDPAIWSFWNSVLNDTDALIAKVAETPVTIEEWHHQRDIHRGQNTRDTLALGFSTFFLNRTNRSGIIKGGGVIGGLNQSGNYKIDCRYNVDDLVKRIRRISVYKDRIHLTNEDAVHFLKNCSNLPNNSLLFIDPPYFKKGPGLYTSSYKPDDHAGLSDVVLRLKSPWIVTYDDVPQIRELYASREQYCFDLYYSLQQKRTGTELLVTSPGLRMPDEALGRQVNWPKSDCAA
jgi:Site-specific DNA methylase